MAGANNGPDSINNFTSNYSGSVGIAVESCSNNTLSNVKIQGNIIQNAKYGVWIGAQYEDLSGKNLGKLISITTGNNREESCTTNQYLSSGITFEDIVAFPNKSYDNIPSK